MEQRYDIGKQYPKFNYDPLAEQMLELRQLRKLVREAETKRRNRRRERLLAERGLYRPRNSA
jgi:hypothetical protein